MVGIEVAALKMHDGPEAAFPAPVAAQSNPLNEKLIIQYPGIHAIRFLMHVRSAEVSRACARLEIAP